MLEYKRYKIFLFFILTFNQMLVGQTVKFNGIIKDSVGKPVEFASVMVMAAQKGDKNQFVISEPNGYFALLLDKKGTYYVQVNSIGFARRIDTMTVSGDTTVLFRLNPSNELLKEVVVTEHSTPIIVKPDTIVYRVDAFINGTELKLKDVLNKLPGIEVDKEGKVTSNGKKVNDLLVEGKPFFYGGTRLGVENIPANAVFEVEVIKDYSESALGKGFADDQKIALNIKLRENKKNFFFGDVELGGGVEKRYLAHPSIFYYSAKVSMNFIGDANNMGKKSFTLRDYIDFEGGMNNPNNLLNLFNSDFANSLIATDFKFNRGLFGALNIMTTLNARWKLNIYTINNQNYNLRQTEHQNIYLINNTIFNTEQRSVLDTNRQRMSINKVELSYSDVKNQELKINTYFKHNAADDVNNIYSKTLRSSSNSAIVAKPIVGDVSQDLVYIKRISKKQTTNVNLGFSRTNSENQRGWLADKPLFLAVLPNMQDSFVNIYQNTALAKNDFFINTKHLIILNNFNHLYILGGYAYANQTYTTLASQYKNDVVIGLNSFNNDNRFLLNDPYIGVQHRVKMRKVTIKSGLIQHFYSWTINNFTNKKEKTKTQLLPELSVSWQKNSSENLDLKYRTTSKFNDITHYANRLILQSFNTLYQGDENLENNFAHQLSLFYSKFNALKGRSFSTSLSFEQKAYAVLENTIINDIESLSTPIYFNNPEHNLMFFAHLSKKKKNFKFNLRVNNFYNNYKRIINSDKANYITNTLGYSTQVEVNYPKYPRLEFGVRQNWNMFIAATNKNSFLSTIGFVNISYDIKDTYAFNFDVNYNTLTKQNNNSVNNFLMGNASVMYNKKLLTIILESNNVFDVKFQNSAMFNQFMVSESKTYLQPRTIILRAIYKL